jgi:hypothetical protein
MRIVQCCIRGQLLRSSVVCLSVGKRKVCKLISVSITSGNPLLARSHNCHKFFGGEPPGNRGHADVYPALSPLRFSYDSYGSHTEHTRIIGLRLLVLSLISFAFMLRLAYVLLEKWRHVH